MWPDHTFVTERSVDSLVKRLAPPQVEADPANPDIILTVWGSGYTSAPMSEPARRDRSRSLYWRIGLRLHSLPRRHAGPRRCGLFIWVAGETEGGMPERMGRDFAELVASEFEAALARDPELDLQAAQARRSTSCIGRPSIVFPDGDGGAAWSATAVGMRMPGPFSGAARRDAGDRRGHAVHRRDGRGRCGRGRRSADRGAVRSWRRSNTTVTWWPFCRVPPLTGLRRVADEIGTTLLVDRRVPAAIGGTAVAAAGDLPPGAGDDSRALEDAARRFGEGDLSARAPDSAATRWRPSPTRSTAWRPDLAARQAHWDADRAQRQLLADVSHELMTPLTAIRGYARRCGLPQFMPPSKEGQRAVKVIHEEGERIERLVEGPA